MRSDTRNKPYAKRSLGQNFLQDENIGRKIVASLDIKEGDFALEIGPGRGALTRWIQESGADVVYVIEKDRDLAFDLKATRPDLNVILIDALQFPWESLDNKPGIRIVGNLPYNVASPLMWEIFGRVRTFGKAVFMIQWEVGLRLTATPGSKQYGALSVWTQNFVQPKLLFKVPPHVFKPRPKVDSAVVGFTPKPDGEIPENPKALASLLHICFQKRRKQMQTILKPYLAEKTQEILNGEGIEATARPEAISPERFARLAARIREYISAR